jgi:hypothetical protein
VIRFARVGDQTVRCLHRRQRDDTVERLDEVREQPLLRKAERAGIEPRELVRKLELREARRFPEQL